MSCGTCTKMRAHLPEAIRKRLEEVERRMEVKRQAARQAVNIKYSVKGNAR